MSTAQPTDTTQPTDTNRVPDATQPGAEDQSDRWTQATNTIPRESLEPDIVSELLLRTTHRHRDLEDFIDRFNWNGRHKPGIHEVLRAGEVARRIAIAMLEGTEKQWHDVTAAWKIMGAARNLKERIKRQVEIIAEFIPYCVPRKASESTRLKVGASGKIDMIGFHIERLHYQLICHDLAFAKLQPSQIRKELSGIKNVDKKGGSGNAGAVAILARLCVLCGANGAQQVNRRLSEGRKVFNGLRKRFASYASSPEPSPNQSEGLPDE